MTSIILEELYKKYDISNLTFGKIHDKLGDLYEEYCLIILNDMKNLDLLKEDSNSNNLEFSIYKSILDVYHIGNFSNIIKIEATNKIPHRDTHGLSKTDVIMAIFYSDGTKKDYAISCKQSYVPKMAFAEFDVNTICKEVGITDERLKYLMLKHQTEKSAKNFSNEEKTELKSLLSPIARKFVRWVITGSIEENPSNLVYPTSIIKFKLRKPKDRNNINIENEELSLQSFVVHSVEEYITNIMFDKKGKPRSGGFGTGLSWTYATGSGGFKIQFKA